MWVACTILLISEQKISLGRTCVQLTDDSVHLLFFLVHLLLNHASSIVGLCSMVDPDGNGRWRVLQIALTFLMAKRESG